MNPTTTPMAARLASEHSAHTLALALSGRLRAEGYEELAQRILSEVDALAAIDPNGPNPHRDVKP